MKYAIIIEKGESNYSAYAPDVLGCIATGDTVEETIQLMKEALEFHFESMKEEGYPIPEPTTHCAYIKPAFQTAPLDFASATGT